MGPVIGVTTGCEPGEVVEGWPLIYTNRHIVKRLENAGALPILIPILDDSKAIKDIIDMVDAVIVSGEVLSIKRNVFKTHSSNVLYNSNPLRYECERTAILGAIEGDKPLLGICRGFQVLNVEEGGSMKDYDITKDNPIIHQQGGIAPPQKPIHEIKIQENTKLKRLLGVDKIMVNSFHRQAVENIPKGYTESAVSPDGCIEAIEVIDDRWVLGVQFHPEILENEIWDIFFKNFVKKVMEYE